MNRNLIDEISILTMENEILRNNNKELAAQRHALMEEVAELRTALNEVCYNTKLAVYGSYDRLNRTKGLAATRPDNLNSCLERPKKNEQGKL